MSGAGGYRRRLVTIAVRDYPYEAGSFAARIDEQVGVLVEWLTDPKHRVGVACGDCSLVSVTIGQHVGCIHLFLLSSSIQR